MYEGRRVLALVPARGRCDGIDHMNMRELGGHPLLRYTLRVAAQLSFVDRLFVSTENERIAAYAREHGVDVPALRSEALSEPDVVMEDIVAEALARFAESGEEFDLVLVLYPNAPFKRPEAIARAMALALSCDFVVPLYGHRDYLWEVDGDRARLAGDAERTSREAATVKHEERGGIYVYNLASGRWADPDTRETGFVEVGFHESRMVNTVYDLLMFERLARLPGSLVDDLLTCD